MTHGQAVRAAASDAGRDQPSEGAAGQVGSAITSTPDEPKHYWLIPRYLIGGGWPARSLDWLEFQGISTIINLTQRSYQDRRFRLHHIPIAAGHPPEMEQVLRFCRLVRRELRHERRVYVHCHNGCGRTGTLLACYLVYEGRYGPADAIARVRALRSCSVESDAQEDAVRDWAVMCASLRDRA